jgi:DNA primase
MAARIPEDFINEVRSNVNIVDVISQYVSLEKKGKDYVGLCPFHQEKTPSFTVNEEKQFFKCFGCGKGGNVFKFLMYKNGYSFPESVAAVADFAHIAMPAAYTQSQPQARPEVKLQEEARDFYHQVLLTTNAGKRGMAYAQKRELTKELLDHFQIGYAPKQEKVLLTYLRGKGYDDEALLKSGLFVQSQDGQLFDRFRDRLMFPLTNESGQVVAFSGRRVGNDKTEAKYLNSPETKIFTKSKLLFHFNEAKKAAAREGHLVLYEGYMDVIAAYRAGVHAGIASMGTSLTTEQVYMLRRVSRNIIINYDGDDPGIHAEERAIKLFQEAGGFNLGLVVLPEKLDPDEYVKKYGAQRYQDQLKAALTTTDFTLRRIANRYNLKNDRDKLAYVDEAVKLIASEADPVAQDLYLKRLGQQTDLAQDALKVKLMQQRQLLRRVRRNTQHQLLKQAPEPAPSQPTNHYDPAQMRLIYLFLHSEHARNYLLKKKFLFPDPDFAEIAELWLKYLARSEKPTINSFLDFIPDQLQGIIVSAEMANMPQDFSERELEEQMGSISRRKLTEQLHELTNEINEAERTQDFDRVLALTQKILELKRIQG